ncbi:MAG: hypothetical protein SGJ19_10360 [Planctomycetia bacterium]|nr:hypothetical protein [Planctomycetia bacterium]
MNETNRRRFCRVLFLLIAISPCCAVLAAAVWRNSAQSEALWQSSLRQTLGVDVEWDRISYPAPGQVRWEGLRFHDVDSGDLVAQVDLCTLTEQGSRLRIAPVAVTVHAQRAEAIVHALKSSFASAAAAGVEIEPCEISVIGGNKQVVAQWSLTRAEAWNVESAGKALIRFQPTGGQEIALHVEQDQANRTFRLSFDTEKRELPLATLNAFFPRSRALGTASTFRGVVQVAQSEDSWDAGIRGTVDQIDLETLVNRHTKQQLTGNGALEIESAQFRNGKLVAAKGKFGATGGEIGVGFLSDVSGGFQFRCDYSKQELDERRFETIKYSQLLVQFDLHEGAIELTGLVEPGQIPLLNEDGDPILVAPAKGTRVSLAYAVQLLFPTAGPRIAAAHESFWLASWLPLPAAGQLSPWRPKEPAQTAPKNLLRQSTAGEP